MVKLGKFGRSAKFGRTATLYVSYFEYWNKKIHQANINSSDETAHKEPSHLDYHCLQMYVGIYPLSEVT